MECTAQEPEQQNQSVPEDATCGPEAPAADGATAAAEAPANGNAPVDPAVQAKPFEGQYSDPSDVAQGAMNGVTPGISAAEGAEAAAKRGVGVHTGAKPGSEGLEGLRQSVEGRLTPEGKKVAPGVSTNAKIGVVGGAVGEIATAVKEGREIDSVRVAAGGAAGGATVLTAEEIARKAKASNLPRLAKVAGPLAEGVITTGLSGYQNAKGAINGTQTVGQAIGKTGVDTGVAVASGAVGAGVGTLGALGMAKLGAALGSFAGPAGTVVGAGLGLAGGWLAKKYLFGRLGDKAKEAIGGQGGT